MNSGTIFNPKVLIGWVAAAAAIFSLAFYLMAYGPAQRPESTGPSAYSRSAIGYAGLASLLQQMHYTVRKSRGGDGEKIVARDLLIIAEPHVSSETEENGLGLSRANNILIILPKWYGIEDADHPGWIGDAGLRGEGAAEWAMKLAGIDGSVTLAGAPSKWPHNNLAITPTFSADVQLVKKSDLQPIVATDDGILIGQKSVNNKTLWVLSDPDLLSNHGLFQGANAEFAMRLVDMLGHGPKTIVFDETVHGFRAPSGNLLTQLLKPPFNYALLQVLLATALLLWATFSRFGKAEAAPEYLAAGKVGLMHNIARLLEFSRHRETIVSSYVQSTIANAARQLRAPRQLKDAALVEWLERVGEARGVKADLNHILREAETLKAPTAADADRLVAIARDVHRWKEEILHGS